MKQLPTAKEWLSNHKELSLHDVEYYDEGGYQGVNENKLYIIMIEFAKIHAEAALQAANNNAELKLEKYTENDWYIDSDSILNAYPLSNIK